MTRLRDATKEVIEALAHDAAIAAASKYAYSGLNEAIRSKLKRPQASSNGRWDPITTAQFLNMCREFVEEDLRRSVGGYSTIRWLWMLRRLPRRIFSGRLGTTYAYDAAMAEVITGLWGAAESKIICRTMGFAYKLDEHVIRRVLRFCEKVRFLSDIHTLIRKAGKGFEFSFGAGGVPEEWHNKELEEGIHLYDSRIAADGYRQPLNRVGTVASSLAADADTSDSVLMVRLLRAPTWLPAVLGSLLRSHVDVEVCASHVPALISLKDLASLNHDYRLLGMQLWSPEAGAVLLLLRLAISLLVNLEGAFCTVLQYGYFLIEQPLFERIVNARVAEACETVRDITPSIDLPATAADLLAALEGISGSVWPLRQGSPIRRAGNILCIDLYMASNLLDRLLEFPSGTGDAANARADHFELAVQNIIDSSPWCPPEELRNYRGRKLRHGSIDITDIDAIGANGGTVVIVSCKSKIYSAAYDAGDYTAIRNARTDIEDAVSKWHRIKIFLETNPFGDNYDLSDYKQLVAVVCTPYPVYVYPGLATQQVAPGLIAASSLSELKTWLMKPLDGSV